ncbi:clathrin light chain A-like [Narcine bancroftii]|uniref:clathrin light chain A-like n=1 Tax=Narcine bancroftii TaxID=1343680 RepID=UPI00383101AD
MPPGVTSAEDMDGGSAAAPGAEDAADFFLSPGMEGQGECEAAQGTNRQADGEETDAADAVNGDTSQNVADVYAAISEADGLSQEPDSIRRWREEQIKHLEALDANSREAELEWREKAKKELEDWYIQQEEQMEEMKTNNSTNIKRHCYNLQQTEDPTLGEVEETSSGTDWERVLHLCDLNSKTSKPSKDVSRMRSVLLSLSQVPVALK